MWNPPVKRPSCLAGMRMHTALKKTKTTPSQSLVTQNEPTDLHCAVAPLASAREMRRCLKFRGPLDKTGSLKGKFMTANETSREANSSARRRSFVKQNASPTCKWRRTALEHSERDSNHVLVSQFGRNWVALVSVWFTCAMDVSVHL